MVKIFINLINEQQAMKQQKYYYEKNLAQAEEENIIMPYAQLMSEGRRGGSQATSYIQISPRRSGRYDGIC